MGELCPECGKSSGVFIGEWGGVREYKCTSCHVRWYDQWVVDKLDKEIVKYLSSLSLEELERLIRKHTYGGKKK